MAFNKVRDDEDDEVEGDMTPMIDIIFLLLVFFILTTKFIPEEKVIANLLPTDKGQSSASTPEVVETEEIKIKIIPGIFQSRLEKVSQYDAKWHETHHTASAIYQVGNQNQLLINGVDFDTAGGGKLSKALEDVHGYLHGHMAPFEGPGPRNELAPVIIMGFSGLPWKYVLAAFDAVRAWENVHGSKGSSVEDLLSARDVTFAPPRIRGFHTWEMGKELFEIHYAE